MVVMVLWAKNTNIDSNCSRTMDPDITLGSTMDLNIIMVSGCSTGQSHQHGLGQKQCQQTVECPQVAAQAIGMHTAFFDGNLDQGHQHSSQLLQNHGRSYEPKVPAQPGKHTNETGVASKDCKYHRSFLRRSNLGNEPGRSYSWAVLRGRGNHIGV